MSVSLIKGSHKIYCVGHNMGGYSPDPENLFYTSRMDYARSALSGEIDRFIEHEAESLDEVDVRDYQLTANDTANLWAGQAYAEAMRDAIEWDSPVWHEVGDDTGVSVFLEDSRGYGYSYWITQTTIRDAFGPDWYDDLGKKYHDEDLSDIVSEWEYRHR